MNFTKTMPEFDNQTAEQDAAFSRRYTVSGDLGALIMAHRATVIDVQTP